MVTGSGLLVAGRGFLISSYWGETICRRRPFCWILPESEIGAPDLIVLVKYGWLNQITSIVPVESATVALVRNLPYLVLTFLICQTVPWTVVFSPGETCLISPISLTCDKSS